MADLPIAVNPKTGKAVQYINNEWVDIPTAVDKGGQIMGRVDDKWKSFGTMSAQKKDVKPDRTVGQTAGDIGYSLAQVPTFGFADEIAAGVTSLLTDKPYEEIHKGFKQRYEENPAHIKYPVEIGGAVAGGILAAPAAAAAGTAMVGARAAQAISKLPKLAKISGLSGLYGGLYGAGAAEEDERLKGAAIGTAAGVALPPAFMGAGKAIGTVAKPIMESARYVKRRVGLAKKKYEKYRMPTKNPKGAAENIIGESLVDAGFVRKNKYTGEPILDAAGQPTLDRTAAIKMVRSLGPEGRVIDILSKGGLAQIRGITQGDSAAERTIIEAVTKRVENSMARIRNTTDEWLDPKEYFKTTEELTKTLQTRAKPFYQRAYDEFPVLSPTSVGAGRFFQNLINQTDLGQKSIATAKELLKLETLVTPGLKRKIENELIQADKLKDLIMAASRARGTGRRKLVKSVKQTIDTSRFSLQTWDLIKRGIDVQLKTNKYLTPEKTWNQLGRAAVRVQDKLIKSLDRATEVKGTSLYKEARQIYDADYKNIQAVEQGRAALDKTSDVIKQEVKKLGTNTEVNLYRSQAAQSFKNLTDAADRVGQILPPLRETNIKTIFGNRAFEKLKKTIEQEKGFAEKAEQALKGEAVAPGKESIEAQKRLYGASGAILAAKLTEGVSLVAASIGRALGISFAKIPTEMHQTIAKLVTSSKPAEQIRGLKMIEPYVEDKDGKLANLLRGISLSEKASLATGRIGADISNLYSEE